MIGSSVLKDLIMFLEKSFPHFHVPKDLIVFSQKSFPRFHAHKDLIVFVEKSFPCFHVGTQRFNCVFGKVFSMFHCT